MKNEIKSIFLVGLGAARLTRTKAEKVLKAFVKQGAITKNQARELTGNMMKEAAKAKRMLKKEGSKEYILLKKKIMQLQMKGKKKISTGVHSVTRRIIRRR